MEHSEHSTVREKTLEHIFIGDCLQALWANGIRDAELLRSDVDAGGYDLVMEVGGILRHIQLKSSFLGASTANQTINAKLMDKPSGCIVWIQFDPETFQLGPFLWFGGEPGERLPDLTTFTKAKHTRGNKDGVKRERKNSYRVPKGKFEKLETLGELLNRLFGI